MDTVDFAAVANRSATSNGQSAPVVEATSQPELPADRFSDRELSWLAFNNRVLDLAKDKQRVPLLERAKFLAIFASNLDEFFMVRVAGLKRRIAAGVAVPTVSGMMPRDVHSAILTRTRELVVEQARVFNEEVRPELEAAGIEILRWDELTPPEWTPASLRAAEEIRTDGSSTPYEKEYYRKDGSR